MIWKFWAQQTALAVEATRLASSASATMWFRLWGTALTNPAEAFRMVAEKPPAFMDAMLAASKAHGRGADQAEVMRRAMVPLRRKTEANARRLSRRR